MTEMLKTIIFRHTRRKFRLSMKLRIKIGTPTSSVESLLAHSIRRSSMSRSIMTSGGA